MIRFVLVLLIIGTIVAAFAGVEPLSTYKDTAFNKVSEWWDSITGTTDNTILTTTSTQTTPATSTAPTIVPSSPTIPRTVDKANYAVLFNEYRQSKGLQPLEFNDDLNRVATLRLAEIKDDFSHNSIGQYNRNLAENIAMSTGFLSDSGALRMWQNSPGHNANMLDSEYKYTGYAAGGGYAVQVFTEFPTINGVPQLPPGWYFTD